MNLCDLKQNDTLDCNGIEVELLNCAFRREDPKEQKSSGASSSHAFFTRGH